MEDWFLLSSRISFGFVECEAAMPVDPWIYSWHLNFLRRSYVRRLMVCWHKNEFCGDVQ